MRRLLPALLAVAALLLTLLASGGTSTAASAAAGPATTPSVARAGDDGAPVIDGVNDYDCRPTRRRPYPAIVVHGTFGDRRVLLGPLQRSLLDAGFCTFSIEYGLRGTGKIQRSARQLDRFVDRVLRATGARKVSMVGHSQGGMMPRYYLKFLGGARKVDDLVGLAPSNHGTAITDAGLNPFNQFIAGPCKACVQQGAGSPFLRKLNRGDETPGRVSYTQVTTAIDEVVIPHTSGYLERGPRTQNVTIQDRCLTAAAEHLLIPNNPTAISIALRALTHRGPWRPRLGSECLLGAQ